MRSLETRRLGRSGLQVTALGLGGAGIGGTAYGEVSDDEAVETVRTAIDGGITYIDTSPLYGESERRLGLALQGGLRDRVVLSTKTGTHPRWYRDYSADATYRSLENSLRLLGTGYIDLRAGRTIHHIWTRHWDRQAHSPPWKISRPRV